MVEEKLNVLRAAIEKGDRESVVDAIAATVPTYHDADEVNRTATDSEEMKQVKSVQKRELAIALE